MHHQPPQCQTVANTLQVNDYQIKLRGMTRRMMATVSELSMYQAHSIKLSADKEALEGVVMAASNKLEVCCCSTRRGNQKDCTLLLPDKSGMSL